MIRVLEIKENESFEIVKLITRSSGEARSRIFTRTALALSYCDDLGRCISDIMDLVRSRNPNWVVLINPQSWMIPMDSNGIPNSSSDPQSIDESDNDSNDDDASDPMQRHDGSNSVNLLYTLCHWISSVTNPETPVYIVTESRLSKRFFSLPAVIKYDIRCFSDKQQVAASNVLVDPRLPASSQTKLMVVGIVGKAGKTITLHQLANPQTMWMYCHEIVNCELGESPRVIRSIFETASRRETPFTVFMDDADLILSTSGRIMREIVEEICACVSATEFSGGYFIYSSRSKQSVPDVLIASTDHFIELD